MDSFHECLQEYGEGLEVVQICLEPEESSIKDEEISALGDLSLEDGVNQRLIEIVDKEVKQETEVNGIKFSKSDESLDEQDDDMTITEDDMLTPRELSDSRHVKMISRNDRSLSKQQSKDISTSDEMVFAVTPTGLERISFEKYWKEVDTKEEVVDNTKNDESWKECLNTSNDDTPSCEAKMSVQENTLLYIDHDIDGYETCLEDDSYSTKIDKTDAHKINGSDHIKASKHDKINNIYKKDNETSAKRNKREQNTINSDGYDTLYGRPYIQEHIIKQMQSLRIEPLNVNIGSKKKKRSPTKPPKHERRCVEYYNDQAECLEEYKRQKKLEEEERKTKQEQAKRLQSNLEIMERKLQLKKRDPSEESTDGDVGYVPGCHKCFLENYAYAITQAYIAEASTCKYCEVIRDMLELESSKELPDRRMSAPALVSLESPGSETDEDNFLMLPVSKDRRTSAGPLKFIGPSRRLR